MPGSSGGGHPRVMILVTGASGTVGRALVAQLLRDGRKVRVLTRNPGRVSFPDGVEIVQGDLGIPSTLTAAVAGVTSVFLSGVGHQRAVHDRNVVTAARGAAVEHVVQLSSLAVEEDHTGAEAARVLAGWHAAGEAALTDSGLPWTILRPNGFMSNALQWARPIAAGETVIRAPFGRLASTPVDPRDLAAVAAVALARPGRGEIHRVTGPEPITPAGQVRVLGELLGLPLRFAEQPLDEARRALARVMPADTADAVLAARAHADLAVRTAVHPTVAELTGRPARSFAEWAADHAASFR